MFKKAYGAISFLFFSLAISILCFSGVAYAADPTITLDDSVDYTLTLSTDGTYTLTGGSGGPATGQYDSATIIKSVGAASGTLTIEGNGSFDLGSIVIAQSSSSGGGFDLTIDEGTAVSCGVVTATPDGNNAAVIFAKALTVKVDAALRVTIPSSSFSTYYGIYLRDTLLIEGDSQNKGTLSILCTESSSPWVALSLNLDSASAISTISGEMDITTQSNQVGILFESASTVYPDSTTIQVDNGSINLKSVGPQVVGGYPQTTVAAISNLTLTNGAEITIEDTSNYFSSGFSIYGTLSLNGGSKLESSTPVAWNGINPTTCIMGEEATIVTSSLQRAFACQDLSIGAEGQGSKASIHATGYGLPFWVQNSATIYGSYDKANGTGTVSINAELLPSTEGSSSLDYAASLTNVQAYNTKIVSQSTKPYSAALYLYAANQGLDEPTVYFENSVIEAQGMKYGLYENGSIGYADGTPTGSLKYSNSSIIASLSPNAESLDQGVTTAVISANGNSYFEGSDCSLQAIGGQYGWYGGVDDSALVPMSIVEPFSYDPGPAIEENRIFAQEGAQLYCEGELCGIRITDSVKSDSGATITACSRSTEPRGLVSGSISALHVDNLIAYPQDANYFIEADDGTINEQYLTKVGETISDTSAGAFSPYNLTWNMVSPLNYQWSTQGVSIGIAATEQGIYSTSGTGQAENNVLFMATRQGPTDFLTVTFETGEGSMSSPSQRVINGQTASRPSNDSVNPPLYGQALKGWYTDSGLEWDFSDPVTQNMTLYAQWDTAVTISCHGVLDGTSIGWSFDSQVIVRGQQVSEPTGTQMAYLWTQMTPWYSEGATFGGWYSDPACISPFEFDFSTPINSDTDIYGKWTSISPKPQMTVSFDLGEGLNTSSIAPFSLNSLTLEQGDQLFESAIGVTPTKPGYRFEGWYADVAFTDPAFRNTNFYDWQTESNYIPVYEDLTLYARWSSVERVQLLTEGSVFNILLVGDFVSQPFSQTYTVSFEPNGGQPKPADQLVPSGMTASEPTGGQKPVKDGFVLEGWYVDSTLTTKWDFSTPVTSNMVLYAKWTGVDPVDPADPGPVDQNDPNRIASLSATGDNISWFALALLSGLLVLIMIGSRILSQRQ